MKYQAFCNTVDSHLTGKQIVASEYHRGYKIIQDDTGNVMVPNTSRLYESFEHAKQDIDSAEIISQLQNELREDGYDLPDVTISHIVEKYHPETRVTNRLIEELRHIAATKPFTLDPIVSEIRSSNDFDRLIESKVDFILDDGTCVAISDNTYELINNTLGEHADVIEYMRASKDNFIQVVRQLKG